MKRTLKTTTALIASVNLAIPFQAFAQADNAALERVIEACESGMDAADCQPAIDNALDMGISPEELETTLGTELPMDGMTDEAPLEAAPIEEAPLEEAPAEEPVEPEAPEAPSEPEAPADAGEAPEQVEEPVQEEVPAPDAPVEDEMDDGPSADDLEQSLEAEEDAEADASVETEETVTEEPLEEEATDEEVVTEEPMEEESMDEEVVTEEPMEEETMSDDGPSEDELQQSLEADGEAEAGAEAGTEVQSTESGEQSEEMGSDDGPSTEDLERSLGGGESNETTDETDETSDETVTDIEEDTSAETDTVEADQQESTAAEEAALQGTAPTAVAADADSDAEIVESETETVTVGNSRSSSEEFETSIARSAAPEASASAAPTSSASNDDDDDGLSKLEKGLLLGAGALAVGALIRNNQRVVASSNDRVVVSRGEGDYEIIKDDNALLRQPGAQVQTETFNDGSSRTTISYDDGSQVVTIRDADLRVIRRVRITPNGDRYVLIDDLNQQVQPVNVQTLQQAQPSRNVDLQNEDALREALRSNVNFDRSYSLAQVRNIQEVRGQVPAIDLEAITFDSGSAAIRPEQADELRALGQFIRRQISDDPRSLFLVEGHTDAVGDAAYNLALSDRRAESVALALGEYFEVPTSNLVVQGYGERFLKVNTQVDERANRRATVRNITPLLQTAAAN